MQVYSFPTAEKDKKSLSVSLSGQYLTSYIEARQGWRSVICVQITWKMSLCNPSLLSQRLHTSGPQRASKLEVNKRDHPTGGLSTGTCLKRLARYSLGRMDVGEGWELWKVRLPCAALLQFFFCITWRQLDFPIPRRHSHYIPLFLSRVELLRETPPTLYRCTMQYVNPVCPSLDLVTSSPAPAVYPEHSSPYSERDTSSASAT